jgi:steroid delta-isomerase-like uncharacterized protein
MKKPILLLIIIAFSINCQNEHSTEEQNKAIVLKWLNETNQENFEQLFDELWAENCLQYLNSNPEPYEYDQFKKMIKNLYSEFPVITHQVHDIFAKGDKVTVLFSAKVKHDVESFGIPATGKNLEWKAIAVFQIVDGKIKTRWEIADMLSMYKQLGMELQVKK